MKRRTISARKKFEVVMETYRRGNVAEVARKYGINGNLLSKWRGQLMENGHEVTNTTDKQVRRMEKQIEKLEHLIGKKEVEKALLQNFFDYYQSPNGE